MPLITQKHGFDVATQRYTREGDPITEYEGRVVARYDLLLTRNFSDTLDYSDYQTAQVVKIVVKLDAPIADRYHYYSNPLYRKGDPFVELEVFSSQYTWRCPSDFVSATVDASPELIAEHEAFLAGRHAEVAAEAARVAQEKLEEEKKEAARRAVAEAREAARKAEAEAVLAGMPEKGTRVTVCGMKYPEPVVGTVFWKGVKQYRGKWHARLGVKRNPKDRDEDPMWVGDGEYTVERVIKLGATPA